MRSYMIEKNTGFRGDLFHYWCIGVLNCVFCIFNNTFKTNSVFPAVVKLHRTVNQNQGLYGTMNFVYCYNCYQKFIEIK